jgi:hypothetical protein
VSLLADTTPLRTPDFRRLWLAGVVTVIGANLTIFAVPVQIYALTRTRRTSACRVCSRWFHWSCSGCGAAHGPTRWTGASC